MSQKLSITPLDQCGQGSYGKVLMAFADEIDVPLAIKKIKKPEMAQIEREIIQKLNSKGFRGFPYIFTKFNLGAFQDIEYLVTDLIGSSLSWFNKNKQLTLHQIYNIGIQLIQRARDMHSIGYVHGDIKPCNILIGREKQFQLLINRDLLKDCKNANSDSIQLLLNILSMQNLKYKTQQFLYLIDFGISYKYIDQKGKILPQKIMRNIRCSPQYSGMNQLEGMSLCRKDDMEAIFYTLISLLGVKQSKISNFKNKLVSDNDLIAGLNKDNADSGQQQLNKIKNMKKNISCELIKQYLPDGFADYYQNVVCMSHNERPDYDKLIRFLEKGKAKIPSYAGTNPKTSPLVDHDLLQCDPLFLKFSKSLIVHFNSNIQKSENNLKMIVENSKKESLNKEEQKIQTKQDCQRNNVFSKNVQSKEVNVKNIRRITKKMSYLPVHQINSLNENCIPDSSEVAEERFGVQNENQDKLPQIVPHHSIIAGFHKMNGRVLKNIDNKCNNNQESTDQAISYHKLSKLPAVKEPLA